MGSLYFRLTHAELGDLVATAQAKPSDDSPEMNEILRRFVRLAERIARDQSRCPHTQAELVNESLRATVGAVRAHRLDTPGFPSYVESFMRGAAHRLARRLLATRVDAHGQPIVSLTSEIAETWSVHPDSVHDQAISSTSPWGDGPLVDVIERLPADQRSLLTLVHCHGYKVKDIAARDGVSSSAVSQRLGTANRSVHRALLAS